MKTRKHWVFISAVCAVLLGGCARQPQSAGGAAPQEPGQPAAAGQKALSPGQPAAARQAPAEPVRQAPPKPRTVTLAEGTPILVRTMSTLSTKSAEPGEAFEATLAEPLKDGERVLAPVGTVVTGRVVESDPGGRVKGVASIAVQLTSLRLEGRTVNLTTGTIERQAKTTKKSDATKVAVGSGVGAAIGAIAGGGRGAAIGAGAGAAAGGGVVLATRGEPAVIPSETLLTFKLRAPVSF